jgi:hypothetical protein
VVVEEHWRVADRRETEHRHPWRARPWRHELAEHGIMPTTPTADAPSC